LSYWEWYVDILATLYDLENLQNNMLQCYIETELKEMSYGK